MEKYAVDLDKVLDDFEYNEEQAVRPSQYIRADLPAKKYQRPPFQRINIEDADFSPSKQTSNPVIPYISAQSPPSRTSNSNGALRDEEASPPESLSEEEEDLNISLDVVPSGIEAEENLSVPDLLENDKSVEESLGSLKLPDVTETVVGESGEPERGITCDLIPDNPSSHLPAPVLIQESHHNELCNIDTEENGFLGDESIPEPILGIPATDDDLHAVLEPDNLLKPSSQLLLDDSGREDEEEEVVEDLQTEKMDIILEEQFTCATPISEKVVYSSEIDENGNEPAPHVYEVHEVTEVVPIVEVMEENKEENEIETAIETVRPISYESEISVPDDELEKYLEQLEVEDGAVGEESEVQVVEEISIEEVVDKIEERPQRPNYLDLSNSEAAELAAAAVVGTPGATEGEEENVQEDRDNEINEREETVDVEQGKGVASSRDLNSSDALTDNVSASPPSPPESPTNFPLTLEERRLGKVSPFWVPDTDALNCMHCGLKFTLLKRRHHCRGCGRVLCGKCCGMRASLEYLGNQQHRVCEPCFRTLAKVMMYEGEMDSDADVDVSPRRRPNPNNPMEYCSTVPPPLQASPSASQPPPSVLVPVLKREGSAKNKEPHNKKVMFSDGIRPGGELTALDEPASFRSQRGASLVKRVGTPPGSVAPSPIRMLPPIDPATQSFIINNGVPPICEVAKGRVTYQEPWSTPQLMERLTATDEPPLLFAVNRHLTVSLKIVHLDCCMMKTCWVMSTRGMSAVGQDEIMVLLQATGEEDEPIPVEVFLQLHFIHQAADKGDVIKELGYWSVKQSTFLGSRQHGGFLFIRPTFQCVRNLDKPRPPYLVAVLIHRFELPWARLFPLRLMLRLGAEFRYYPCSLVSVRHREPVYFEIGQTIINLLADFRNYSYSLPEVQGLRIHMEPQKTSLLVPKNRYDRVIAALNNSNEPVLPFAGTFSPEADSHLVCMQSHGDEVSYHTQVINIHDKPRKVTGTSFIVFNASLKSTAGVQAKSDMVEDGVMVQVGSDTMTQLRAKLRAMEGWSVRCGPNNEDIIQIVWCDDDKDFNIGVRSPIDGMPMDGVPSIRVHSGTNSMCSSRFIRWTEVFIIKCEDGATSAKIGDPLELNRLAEAISRATCTALTKANLLDHLAAADITMLALRATVTQDQVCYEAGGNEQRLEPIFMNSLDNELIPVLHKASATNTDSSAILELVFHILDQ